MGFYVDVVICDGRFRLGLVGHEFIVCDCGRNLVVTWGDLNLFKNQVWFGW